MIISNIIQIIIGLMVLGVLVFIHELGHFLAAKKFGIRVLSFSIGFGKVLLKKTYKDTEYRISAIPFGGYVHMAGEHPEDNRTCEDSDFMAKPVWQRAIVSIAGPAANIITSIAFLWIVFMGGIPRETYLNNTIVGDIIKDSPAKISGFMPGDSIISINGELVKNWEDINRLLVFNSDTFKINIIRQNNPQTVLISGDLIKVEDALKKPAAGLIPPLPAVIGTIQKDSPAEAGGLKKDDIILAIDNISINSWYQIPEIINSYSSVIGTMQIIVKRGDLIQVCYTIPQYDKKNNRYLLGIIVAAPATETIAYPPGKAISKALNKSLEYTVMIFDVLKKLVSGAVSPKHLAGPVGIVQMSGTVAFGGILALLNFMALIGINLGVINLFPLVITDGGVLSLLAVEAVRGKPLSLKTQLILNRVFMSLFLTLFILITFNDILRIPLLMIGK